jgi:hypothetical protein
MVKGEWIIFPDEMRSKNWANGIEVSFCFNESSKLEGKIRYVPPQLINRMPSALNLAVFLCRQWRQACSTFEKAYYRKKLPH